MARAPCSAPAILGRLTREKDMPRYGKERYPCRCDACETNDTPDTVFDLFKTHDGKVIMQFGEGIRWVEVTPERAQELGCALIESYPPTAEA